MKVYEIPNSVTTIGEEAFSRCSALQSIDIPNSVTTIEDRAFECCSALQSINVSENNQYFTSINGIIFNKSLTTIIKFPQGHKLKGYITPNSVTKIGDSAFQGCSSLQHINIPNSVTKIARGAFRNCSSLQSIDIPNSVTKIGDTTFCNAVSLHRINVSQTNKSYASINNILFNKEQSTIIRMPIGADIKDFHIPISVSTINPHA